MRAPQGIVRNGDGKPVAGFAFTGVKVTGIGARSAAEACGG